MLVSAPEPGVVLPAGRIAAHGEAASPVPSCWSCFSPVQWATLFPPDVREIWKGIYDCKTRTLFSRLTRIAFPRILERRHGGLQAEVLTVSTLGHAFLFPFPFFLCVFTKLLPPISTLPNRRVPWDCAFPSGKSGEANRLNSQQSNKI